MDIEEIMKHVLIHHAHCQYKVIYSSVRANLYMCSGFRRGGETAENDSWLQLNHLFNNRGSCLSHAT